MMTLTKRDVFVVAVAVLCRALGAVCRWMEVRRYPVSVRNFTLRALARCVGRLTVREQMLLTNGPADHKYLPAGGDPYRVWRLPVVPF